VVLVAGASGFVGRYVVQALLDPTRDVRVIRLDRNVVEEEEPASDTLVLDVGDTSRLVQALHDYGVQTIVNCTGGTDAFDWAALCDAYVTTTNGLLRAAKVAGGRIGFCQLGSGAEYKMLPQPQQTSEGCPTSPAGAYGRAKLEASNSVLRAAKEGWVAGYVLRLFNPIGVGMPASQLVGRIARYLRGDSSSSLAVGDLGSYRDFLDVRDAARAIALSGSDAGRLSGEVVNVGSGVATSTRTLVSNLLAAAGRGAVMENRDTGSQRSRGVNWQVADIAKAQELLRWRPTHAMCDTIGWLAQ